MSTPEEAPSPALASHVDREPRIVLEDLVAYRNVLEKRVKTEKLELPPLPDTALKLITLCHDSNVAAQELVDTLSNDQALCTRILRVSNSAAYSGVVQIISVQLAITRLGFENVRDIAISAALQQAFEVSGWEEDIEGMWKRSSVNSGFAKEIARRAGVGGERAGLFGLLQDVGRPISLFVMKRCEEEVGRPLERPVAERVMDEYHASVGAFAAKSWDMPDWVQAVLYHHHNPRAAGEWRTEASVAHLADRFARWALRLGRVVGPSMQQVAREIGLGYGDLVKIGQVAPRILEIAHCSA